MSLRTALKPRKINSKPYRPSRIMPSKQHPRFEELLAAGQARRLLCSRTSQALCSLASERDPVALVEATSAGRVPALVPLRYARMAASPFSFFRGLALVQAADLASQPHSGITVQACGDAHLMNYGFFASPERNLLFDICDFDETHQAPWEWDIKRLNVSLILAARTLGISDQAARGIVQAATGTYRRRMHEYARMSQMDVWYSKVSYDQLCASAPSDQLRQTLEKIGERARNRTHLRLLPKITADDGVTLRLKDTPPTLFHLHEANTLLPEDDQWLATPDSPTLIKPMMEQYLTTLKEDRAQLVRRFRIVDMAFKVVGVGSVGTRCLVILLQDDYDQPLFLQLKEARPSVLERFTQPCTHGHQGKRVVFGQRVMQAASDLFLGWTTGPAGRDFYVRQLRDMKASAQLESFDTETLRAYAQACAWTLARAHAKSSGQAAMIAGYLGNSGKFADSMAQYSILYADQVESDYDAFRRAIESGRLPVDPSAEIGPFGSKPARS
ncbi:DUF2252 domain-containing protein [Craterilacuibacter sp.]|uniref:DUF2252 domain-containing protein n=1 Tax=Craterilacuibacter sp. TaxID=2870909 RepID=UPI003F2A65A7